MPTILTVLGTRPEAVKLAPVLEALARRPEQFTSKVCITSQHQELVRPFLELFQIEADYDLELMRPDQTLSHVTTGALQGMEEPLRLEKPDIVLVQGDTTTAFAASLAAFYQGVPVGHVEAGLRSGQLRNPYPEEANRRLIAVLADLMFAPTETARDNLLREGADPSNVFVTGNTVVDALKGIRDRSAGNSDLPVTVSENARVVLVTGHRRESFGEGFSNICRAVRRLADANSDVTVIYPVHLNPRVQEPVFRILGGHERIHLIDHLPYVTFIRLVDMAYLVLTDSGGVQEEAAVLGRPVLVMRSVTERVEGVSAGVARLVDTDEESIVRQAQRLLDDTEEYDAMSHPTDVYGDGHAGERIVDILADRMDTTSPEVSAQTRSAASKEK